ncbi:hypothetical protein SY28_03345 [Meiothermus taiwanensis]|nr:hypothetical protein SY28_03345 [Meiothermus taiwanensis]KZK16141.1 hypothetical protein A3962_07550 [Meiothermus taiwanensis]
MRLSYRPEKDREGLDPEGYERLSFYGDFFTEDELASIARALEYVRKNPLPDDPEELEAQVREAEERRGREQK